MEWTTILRLECRTLSYTGYSHTYVWCLSYHLVRKLPNLLMTISPLNLTFTISRWHIQFNNLSVMTFLAIHALDVDRWYQWVHHTVRSVETGQCIDGTPVRRDHQRILLFDVEILSKFFLSTQITTRFLKFSSTATAYMSVKEVSSPHNCWNTSY